MSAPPIVSASSIMRSLPSTFDQTSLDRIANLEPLSHPYLASASPTDPILAHLYKNKSIPKSFSFSAAEEATLKAIFSKWHLDTKLTLFDILGLEIYTEFERICGAYSEKQPLLERVAGSLFRAFFLGSREFSPLFPVNNKSRPYIQKYLGTFSNVEELLKVAFKNLKAAKKSSFDKIKVNYQTAILFLYHR